MWIIGDLVKNNSLTKLLKKLAILTLSFMLIACGKQKTYDAIINLLQSNANVSLKTVKLDFGDIVYLESDYAETKETVVMLHGFGADKNSWLRFAAKLPDRYRLIIPDLPGHGDSVQRMDLSYDITSQTDRVVKFLNALQIKQAHLVGNSMGGAIAIQLSYRYPQMVNSLTLIASHGAVKTPSLMDKIYQQTGKIPMVDIKSKEDFKKSIEFSMANPIYIPDFMLDVLVEQKIQRHAIEQKLLKDVFIDIDQTEHLSEVNVPTLILWGTADKVLHVDNADLFQQKIPQSRKVIMNDVGHVPMVERPSETAAHFLEFLSDLKIGNN